MLVAVVWRFPEINSKSEIFHFVSTSSSIAIPIHGGRVESGFRMLLNRARSLTVNKSVEEFCLLFAVCVSPCCHKALGLRLNQLALSPSSPLPSKRDSIIQCRKMFSQEPKGLAENVPHHAVITPNPSRAEHSETESLMKAAIIAAKLLRCNAKYEMRKVHITSELLECTLPKADEILMKCKVVSASLLVNRV